MIKAATLRMCVKWALLGAVVGIVANYYLYRVWLPIAPFVYQAF